MLFLTPFCEQGKYTVNAKILTPDERQITCLTGVTTFPRKFGFE
jgi:hypothetical protein